MSENRGFHTTTTAEFREIAAAAKAAGRLPELIKAIEERLERYRATLELYESTRDFQHIHTAKKSIANLESKLELARKLESKKDKQ